MSNLYDRVIKEIIEDLFVPMAQRMFGIRPEKTEELPDELHHTIERKPDFLKKVLMDSWGPDYILHFEFQSRNDWNLVLRMLEYYALLYRKYRLPIVQCVFYIGNAPLRMHGSIEHERLLFSYRLRDIRSVSAVDLIQSQIPEEIVFAILGDFKSESPDAIIRKILHRLAEISESGPRLDRRIKQLEIMAQLRKLDSNIKSIVNTMPITIDFEKLSWFKAMEEGWEKGLAKGMEEGIEKGMQKGIQKGMQKGMQKGIQKGIEEGIKKEKLEIIKRMLQSDAFRNQLFTIDDIAQITDTEIQKVQKIRDSLKKT